jgi:hypothetical protein
MIVDFWNSIWLALNPAATVATTALVFTVASFWWLNIRQGRLRSYAPQAFAAALRDGLRIRLPLVLHATGAKPIIVQDMRLGIICTEVDAVVLEWVIVRSQLKPASDDDHQFASAFVVPGRGAVQLFAEFVFDGETPRAMDGLACRARLDVRQGHRHDWKALLEFDLHTERIKHPNNFIAYRNRP